MNSLDGDVRKRYTLVPKELAPVIPNKHTQKHAHAHTHRQTHRLTHSLTHSLTYSHTLSHTTHSLSLTLSSLPPSQPPSLPLILSHSLTHSPSRSRACLLARFLSLSLSHVSTKALRIKEERERKEDKKAQIFKASVFIQRVSTYREKVLGF